MSLDKEEEYVKTQLELPDKESETSQTEQLSKTVKAQLNPNSFVMQRDSALYDQEKTLKHSFP